ncbi:MAG: Mut7-C RNAse domain-containing protein [Candidatus Hodarchaeota archaeon]
MTAQRQTEIKFIVDAMLGSLSRWLRFLGFDTWFCATQTDDEILDRVNSRVLLTRDKELIHRALHRGCTVVNPGYRSIRSMLQKLQEELGLQFVADPMKSRCPECNSSIKVVGHNEVIGLVPSKSLHRHDTFWQCENKTCLKVYWQGRHWTRIQKTLAQL